MDKHDIGNTLCEAVEILVKRAFDKAKYNITEIGSILECIDETIGKYRVKIQDNTTYAYSIDNSVRYGINTPVYVMIPNNDYKNQKIILGATTRIGSEYLNSSYSIDFAFEKGQRLTYENNSLPVVATPSINNIPISTQDQTLSYFWFIEDGTITVDSNEYMGCAGAGWRCLNSYSIDNDSNKKIYIASSPNFNVGTQIKYNSISSDGTLDISKRVDFSTHTGIYLCCAIFEDGTIAKNIFTIINDVYDIDIKLSSSCGNKFYSNNIPYTNIFCNIVDKEGKDITSQYSLKWNVEGIKELIEVNQRNNIDNIINNIVDLEVDTKYEDNLDKYIEYTKKIDNDREELKKFLSTEYLYSDNGLYNVPIEDINLKMNICCSVYKDNILQGSKSIILYNYLENKNSTSHIELIDGDSVFCYNKNGDIRVKRQNLSFKLFDDAGHDISDKISEEDIVWSIPKEENSLIRNIEINGKNLNYDISNKYNKLKTDNTINLVVNYNGLILTKDTQFSFLGPDEYSLSYWLDAGIEDDKIYVKMYCGDVEVIPDDIKIERVYYSDKDSQTGYYSIDKDYSIIKNDGNRNNNANDVFRISATYDSRVLTKTIPIIYKEIKDEYDISLTGGYNNVTYDKDGINPHFIQSDFKITILDNNKNDISDFKNIEYIWSVVSYDIKIKDSTDYLSICDLKNSKFFDLNKNISYFSEDVLPYNRKYAVQLLPLSKYNISSENEHSVPPALICQILLDDEEIGYFHIPINFEFDSSSLDDITNHGGNISIGQDEIQNIQQGIGSIDEGSGIFFGKTTKNQGLIGYSNTKRTFVFDGYSGNILLGDYNNNKIIYSPDNNSGVGSTLNLADGSFKYNDDISNQNNGLTISGEGILTKGIVGSSDGLIVTDTGFIGHTNSGLTQYIYESDNFKAGHIEVKDNSTTIGNLEFSENLEDITFNISPKDKSIPCIISPELYIGDICLQDDEDHSIGKAKTGYLVIEGSTNHRLYFKNGLFVGWQEFDKDAEVFSNVIKGNLSVDNFMKAITAVISLVKKDNFTYGNSTTKPPCQQENGTRYISCDRLISFALWEMGYKNQPAGGYAIHSSPSIISFLRELGFKESFDIGSIKRGSIVFTRSDEHVFVIDHISNGKYYRYDTGSQNRIVNEIKAGLQPIDSGLSNVSRIFNI